MFTLVRTMLINRQNTCDVLDIQPIQGVTRDHKNSNFQQV